MYGYVYLTTNLLDNKMYIGQHKSTMFDEYYYGSGKIITRAINKYGIQNFKCDILKWCETEEELNYWEEYYIDKFNCVESDQYYNLKPGGLGKSESGLTYIRNLVSGKCKKVSQYELDSFLSNSDWVIGGPIPTKESIRKRSEANTGKKRSTEQRKHISDSLVGKQLSDAHKQALRKKKSVANWKNGLIQVYDGKDYIFIQAEQLDYYLANGYMKKGKPKSAEHHKNVSNGKKGKIRIINKYDNKVKYIDKANIVDYEKSGDWLIPKLNND